MPLVRGESIVTDRYLRVLDGEPIPADSPAIVPAARFIADIEEMSRRHAPTGVLWPNSRRVSELAPHLDRVALIALEFPSFKDGRAYSQARVLREQYGFRGELRATGNVLRDQFLFLLRAGFDSFEVMKEVDAVAFAAAVARYSVFYQPAADRRISAFQARLRHTPQSPAGARERV